MYLYNVSIITEESSHAELLTWVQNHWLPQLPEGAKFLKMLHSPHEGHTYCVHLVVHGEAEVQQFSEQYIQNLQQYITQNHKDKAFLFDSIMQYLTQ